MEDTDLVASLIPAIEQQLESPETPFVKKTYERLMKDEETDEEDVLYMMAICLADESNRMFIDKRDFDIARYKELLDALPEIPQG
ncbi:hypothetical protein SAMN02745181_3516 [Rubritalea squalenifaciens DSM 18772]|uniref:Uncharacterized protein n=2 Tax=Rubritalea TaxID=361050 RepID=A0A1M6R0K9_9BACT|nr:hypothetical protein [Rubritalea squalenifaciens]SHK26025.1 hypothetical protein SAMN02745181_3516 [Rubritalea squalenifaciens DSM 18772]